MQQLKKILDNKEVFVAILIFFDILSVVLAFYLAYYLRNVGLFRTFLDSIQPIQVYIQALPGAIILLLILLSLQGLYYPKQRVSTFLETYALVKAVTFWIILIMAGSYIMKVDYSRVIIALMYFLTIASLILFRLMARLIQKYLVKKGVGHVHVSIIGSGKTAKHIATRLQAFQSFGIEFCGFITTRRTTQKAYIGTIHSLQKLIATYHLDEIYIADGSLSHEEVLTLVAKSSKFDVKFKVTSNIFDLIAGNINVASLENIPTLDVSKLRFPVWKRLYKYIFDFLFAFLGILITLPLWIVIIIAIKLDTPGRAIFAQRRVGLYGNQFKIYKFRTMLKETPVYSDAPRTKRDNRVTRVGKFLRQRSLDELPQLINILKGEMSIVGPRPEMPYVVKNYTDWQKRRFTVKPGLTGLWQILGRKDLPLTENLEYDFYYINNQSFILDLVIILKTIPVVLFGKGAY